MISHKHNCVFVHVPKVAGISIEQIFLQDLGLDYVNRMSLLMGLSTNKTLGPPRVSHLIAQEYVDHHYMSQEQFNNYFTFGWVRHPYGRVYSFYRYLGYKELISFENFVIEYLPKIFVDNHLYFFIQPMWNYLAIDDQLAVDFVGRLENIKEDMQEVFKQTGIESCEIPHANNSEKMSLKTHLKRSFRIVKKYPRVILNIAFAKAKKKNQWSQEMKEQVYELYEKDFLKFNYEK